MVSPPIIELIGQYRVVTRPANVFSFGCQRASLSQAGRYRRFEALRNATPVAAGSLQALSTVIMYFCCGRARLRAATKCESREGSKVLKMIQAARCFEDPKVKGAALNAQLNSEWVIGLTAIATARARQN